MPVRSEAQEEANVFAGTEPVGDILVVDDNPSNLLAIEAALKDLGCRLVMAGSGSEALRLLLDEDYALILLDVQMPTMDGFETAHLIRNRNRSRHTPIIFITAYNRDEQEILKGYELGAVDFLFKPIVPEMLRAKASVFVELRRRAEEVRRQTALLSEHERREHARRLEEERQLWERNALRAQMNHQKRLAEEMARKAEELARTVAERERAEHELTRINRELELADKRKDAFLALLAHELRNPLAPIVTGLELIPERELQTDSQKRARRVIERQTRQLARLVDDLLDVARVTSDKIELRKEPVDIAQILEQAVATSRPILDDRKHELAVNFPAEQVVVDADPVRLTQVAANLINNAARYTEPNGTIEVNAVGTETEAVFTVSDNGPGIEPELMDSIFDMFVQKKLGGGGLGLGLTLVRSLVQLHGGTVSARNKEQGGSIFEVRLSRLVGQAPADDTVPDADSVDDTPLHVVVIDDNNDIRETLRQLLMRWGHKVDVAQNGLEGVELVTRVRPEVALVDIDMPELDGYGVAARLCQEMPIKPRLIALTGFGQPRDRDKVRAAGFNAHLVKPVGPLELRRALSAK